MFEHRIWGSRLMWWDVPMLIVCALFTTWIWPTLGPLSLLCPMVFGHFMVFCNIVRLRTRLELTWAVIFLLNVTAWLWSSGLDVMGEIFVTQLPVTCVLIAIELRSPRYHGILADRINPQLDHYITQVKSSREP